MNRSICSTWRAALLALGVCLAALVVLSPSTANAGLPFRVQWQITQENPTCESAGLGQYDGQAFFRVNDTPLPTRQLSGALQDNPDGSQSNTAEAHFDSVLLSPGDNSFLFEVTDDSGNNSCVHSRNVVTLISDPIGLSKTLFNVRRDGSAFVGTSAVQLSLAEINPPLAKDIAMLEAAITAERTSLIVNAAQVSNLAAKQSLLQQLDVELHDLVSRPLDEIAKADLDAILDHYGDVIDPATRAALEQLLIDLAQSAADLKDQLASLIDDFGAQADAVVALVTKDAEANGFAPDDPTSYGLGAADVPWVDVPDISGVAGAFSPGNDPYAAYAAKVIEALSADVDSGEVTQRAGFVATVRAWHSNDKALGDAVKARAMVSQAETNAFTNAHNSVVQYIQTFMDADGWLKDASAPVALRGYVDGVLEQGFADLSDEMKDALNIRDPDTIDLADTQIFQTIVAFGGAMSTVVDGVKPYADVMLTLVAATERIGVGFVPFVGPALDLCECVTGKEWCLPSGADLSTGQRVFAGAGVAIGGVAHYWAGVKAAGVSPAVAVIAADVAKVDEAIAQGLHANPRTWYKTLRGAASEITEPFEKEAGRWLQKDGRALIGIGDDGVRKVLGIPKDAPDNLAKAADFLSVTKGNKLAISEVKGGANVKTAVAQLTNTMKALDKLGLAGDVERVEVIVKKGVALSDRNFTIKNGYLFDLLLGKPVELEGYKNVFIKAVEL
jgi:hypothetical protein